MTESDHSEALAVVGGAWARRFPVRFRDEP